MGRKKIIKLNSHKFSVDVSGENKKYLDELTDNLGMKYGPSINLIISVFAGMPKDIKATILGFCEEKYRELTSYQKVADEMEKAELENKKEWYLTIARLMNKGRDIVIKHEDAMRKIEIKNGYLIIPADWIILNPEQAKYCMYAGVLECRNSARYGIPHFVFFSDTKYACDYDALLYEHIQEMCTKAWPDYKALVLDRQVKLIMDPDRPGQYLNAQDFMEAPTIGHFHISESSECDNPPCGAVIVRTK